MVKRIFGRYIIETSSEDKILFPKHGKAAKSITKGDVIEYYNNIASLMLPYLKNRPLMMHRFPNGIDKESFYQKNASDYFPDWIKQVKVPLKDGSFNNYVVCQNKATLVYLANQACITPHVWLSQISDLNYPNRLIFDLDPSELGDFKPVCQAALLLKKCLKDFGLESFVMTTGSHGLHVVVPLVKSATFEETREFAIKCAKILITKHPDLLTLEIRKNKRGKRIFVDTLRNQYGATAVAPYAIRAKPNAPIATPLDWKELSSKDLTAQKYNISNIFDRLNSIQDPWKKINKIKQTIKKLLD